VTTPKKFVGYCDPTSFQVCKGQWVTIPKGTLLGSTGPGKHGPAGRTYKVRIHSITNGWSREQRHPGDPEAMVVNPTVQWAGAGGYWTWADMNDIPEAVG
jgi:hypothetical protein